MSQRLKSLIVKIPPAHAVALGVRRLFRKTVISRQVKQRLRTASVRRIIVGSSGVTVQGWIGTDVDYLDLLKESDWRNFFEPDSINAILAEHVWEHLTGEQGFRAAAICFKYMRSGGYMRVAVPDGMHPDPDYIERVRVDGWGEGAHDHKVLYTHETLRRVFETAGFQVRLLEYFDAAGVFHQEQWSRDAGMIHRSLRFDERNVDGKPRYTSVILDAWKP
jgi:predicted SAM-dependent methyltransferase